MKFFLDSADAQQWALPSGCPPVQGVTTNPTLVMQAGLPVSLTGYLQLVRQAGEARLPELMLQLPRADVGERRRAVRELGALRFCYRVALPVGEGESLFPAKVKRPLRKERPLHQQPDLCRA